jgi:hypothetical protein
MPSISGSSASRHCERPLPNSASRCVTQRRDDGATAHLMCLHQGEDTVREALNDAVGRWEKRTDELADVVRLHIHVPQEFEQRRQLWTSVVTVKLPAPVHGNPVKHADLSSLRNQLANGTTVSVALRQSTTCWRVIRRCRFSAPRHPCHN